MKNILLHGCDRKSVPLLMCAKANLVSPFSGRGGGDERPNESCISRQFIANSDNAAELKFCQR